MILQQITIYGARFFMRESNNKRFLLGLLFIAVAFSAFSNGSLKIQASFGHGLKHSLCPAIFTIIFSPVENIGIGGHIGFGAIMIGGFNYGFDLDFFYDGLLLNISIAHSTIYGPSGLDHAELWGLYPGIGYRQLLPPPPSTIEGSGYVYALLSKTILLYKDDPNDFLSIPILKIPFDLNLELGIMVALQLYQ